MEQHARLSPSASERWMKCTASVPLVEALPPDPGSIYAAEGTKAHSLLAHLLTHGGDMPGDGEYDEEMIAGATVAFTYVMERRREALAMYVEQRVNLGKLTEGMCWGTADVILVFEDSIEVIDYKYGRGVFVDVERNPQLMLYGIGACASYNLTPGEVKLTVIQPRTPFGEPIRSWECKLPELVEFGHEVNAAYQQIKRGEGTFHVAEETCRWCRAKLTCPAVKSASEELMRTEFEKVESTDEIAEWLRVAPALEAAIASAREHAALALQRGVPVPGFKLVAGRSTRKWSDEAKVVKWLKSKLKVDQVMPRELISVAVAEKLLKPLDVAIPDAYVEKAPGKATIAPESDKRPALTGDFTVTTEE